MSKPPSKDSEYLSQRVFHLVWSLVHLSLTFLLLCILPFNLFSVSSIFLLSPRTFLSWSLCASRPPLLFPSLLSCLLLVSVRYGKSAKGRQTNRAGQRSASGTSFPLGDIHKQHKHKLWLTSELARKRRTLGWRNVLRRCTAFCPAAISSALTFFLSSTKMETASPVLEQAAS